MGKVESISVVMATWQGERFLPRQLASLLGQIRLPDELVVVDDASADSTPEIVERFAEEAPFPVRLLRSPERKGSTAAFETAIEEAQGTIIALADQDDLWMPQKLARLEAVFVQRPATTFVFTDALLVDDHDVTAAPTMWETRRFTEEIQEEVRNNPFAQLSHRWLATGCTVAFRADLREVLLPFPTDLTDLLEPMLHDRWLSLVLSPLGPVGVLPEPLVCYRIHDAQQIGMANVSAAMPLVTKVRAKLAVRNSHMRDVAGHQLAHLEEVRRRIDSSGLATQAMLDEVDGAIRHWSRRIEIMGGARSRVVGILRATAEGEYRHYARGWSSVTADLARGGVHAAGRGRRTLMKKRSAVAGQLSRSRGGRSVRNREQVSRDRSGPDDGKHAVVSEISPRTAA